MGIARIDAIIHEGQAPSIMGGLIRASIEIAKVELGLGSSLFQSSFKHFGKLATPCWITHSWKFMQDWGIDVSEGTSSLMLRRVGDRFLIETFHQFGFKGKELIRLNRCRLYLQVATVADISTADGRLITFEAWHGTIDPSRPSPFTWPNQGKPPTKDWDLWRRALSLSLCNGQIRRFSIPLGSWTDDQWHKWLWFFAPEENRLYERLDVGWRFYSMDGGRLQ